MSKNGYSYEPLSNYKEDLTKSIRARLIHTVGRDPEFASSRDWLNAVAYAARDRLIERRLFTRRNFNEFDSKRIYYLSMEYLIGRMMINALLNMGFFDEAQAALEELGVDINLVAELEPDAALGNGGLGRLAACIMDSMATQCMPGYAYGIRYEFGMFRQEIQNGEQIEHPDNWLRYGIPWEFPRSEHTYPVHFYGKLSTHTDAEGKTHHYWEDVEEVIAMAYDLGIPGYSHYNVNNLRLWGAKSTRDFDLNYFNEGDYIKAVEGKSETETISKVLYPNDANAMGRELRLKQEYFFVSASLQDILNRFLVRGYDINDFPEMSVIQLNDTHPAIAIPELMRLFIDVMKLSWDKAWALTQESFAYTNHTLMPEALEVWPVELMEKVLPRHMQIIYEINHHFLEHVRHLHPGDSDLLKRVSLIDEGHHRNVRMAYLCVVGSKRVNGVAALHSELIKKHLFHDFYILMPEKFVNVTNGITPRLWLNQANRPLAKLINSKIGNGWVTNLDELRKLEAFANDAEFMTQYAAVKKENKEKLAAAIKKRTGIAVSTNALFDIQVKRIHEYKRQLLNLLHCITLYNRIRHGKVDDMVPRVVLFAGKAAPGYATAKKIIHLINDIADTINNDPMIGDRLKVVFYPNYDVSNASIIIPAADLSEQISTAGTEASGTGNMKLSLNGALTIGTLDGANVEIREEVGEENIFIFGMTTDEVSALRAQGYRPRDYYENNAELREVLDMIHHGYFNSMEPGRYRDLVDNLLEVDHYMLLADYASYIEVQAEVAKLYKDKNAWMQMALLNTARMGKFSIDRTVAEYAHKIWEVAPQCITKETMDRELSKWSEKSGTWIRPDFKQFG
jgi:starch phosphorylase